MPHITGGMVSAANGVLIIVLTSLLGEEGHPARDQGGGGQAASDATRARACGTTCR